MSPNFNFYGSCLTSGSIGQILDSVSGLKLLLKVAKTNDAESEGLFSTRPIKPPTDFDFKSSADVKKEESDEDSDLEPLSEKIGQHFEISKFFQDLEDSGQDTGDNSETSSCVKKRRRKRKFRLTLSGQKKKKAIKLEAVDSEDKRQLEKEPTPEPEPETLSVPMPSRKRLGEYSELQLLIDNLLRTFQRKDPEQYFALPVTDEIAPNYSSVIAKPMDFFTMRVKLDGGEYRSLEQFREDVELICLNALQYNDENTVYHQAAKKLQLVVNYVFSSENISLLLSTLPFIETITLESLGLSMAKPANEKPEPKCAKSHSCIVDNMTPEDILTSAMKASSMAADKLALRKVDCRLGFLKQQEDGATVLNFVTPEKCLSHENSTESEDGIRRQVKLGDLIPKLKEGTPGLPAFSEPSSNLVVPVSYLDYGPYSSFAPQYDSTWATLNKEDSDLLLKTYGDQTCAQYAWSLRSFAKDAEYVSRMVDNVLDALTDGEHSKTVEIFAVR